MRPDWVCCHLGAREHYAVPRALHRRGRLRALATDAWAVPGGAWTRLPGGMGKKLSERYSAELGGAAVHDFTDSLVLHELGWRAQGRSGWALAMARNEWFQGRAAVFVRDLAVTEDRPIVFAHSYAALQPLQAAKARQFSTVLGQIDGGEEHFNIVARLAKEWPEYGPAPEAPPASYFAAWREECALADVIVVNSEWSRELLDRAGIPTEKLAVVPLAYEPERGEVPAARSYPSGFSPQRPLRALFVGSAAVAKGVPSLLEAMTLLRDRPVHLTIVGDEIASIPSRFRNDRTIHWTGQVSRSEVMAYYRDSDVLVFPSHSDGFGMAQVEAQGWQLPIIASRCCGPVVQDGLNGVLLPDVSAASIAAALTRVLDGPAALTKMAQQSGVTRLMTLDALGDALIRAVAA